MGDRSDGAWGDDAELAVPIDVLAANEWFNAPIFYSSLAATST